MIRRLLRFWGWRPAVVKRLERLCREIGQEEVAAAEVVEQAMGYARRTDASHAEVRETLRQLGYTVVDTARVGGGFPDLVAAGGPLSAGAAVFIEVKAGKGKLRAVQEAFRDNWPGTYVVLRSAEDVVNWHRKVAA